VRLEGVGKLKKLNDIIGNRNCDLPACSIVPLAKLFLYRIEDAMEVWEEKLMQRIKNNLVQLCEKNWNKVQ
jgi:hypothetical protein